MKKIKSKKIIDCARGWIGTPYKHQSSLKGVGTDCLGLIRGVWRELAGQEPERAGAYTPGWDDHDPTDILLKKAHQHLVEIDGLEDGCVIIFRMAFSGPAKHMAIYSGNGNMIHAVSGSSCCEVCMNEVYKKRMVACFKFPFGEI
jgi:NlpC/P60 family putative phage cell wall peptidase